MTDIQFVTFFIVIITLVSLIVASITYIFTYLFNKSIINNDHVDRNMIIIIIMLPIVLTGIYYIGRIQ